MLVFDCYVFMSAVACLFVGRRVCMSVCVCVIVIRCTMAICVLVSLFVCVFD